MVEIIGAAVIYGFRNDIEHSAIKGFKDAMRNYHFKNDTRDYSVIDDIQESLKCCGAERVEDWKEYPPYNDPMNIFYPPSCCDKPWGDKACVIPYQKPCWQAIEEEVRYSARTLANTCIAVAIIQFLTMLAACVLARNFKREYDVV